MKSKWYIYCIYTVYIYSTIERNGTDKKKKKINVRKTTISSSSKTKTTTKFSYWNYYVRKVCGDD